MEKLVNETWGSQERFIEWYLDVVSGLMTEPLSKKEKEVLFKFLTLTGKDVYFYDRFGGYSKKEILRQYKEEGINMSRYNLYNHLRSLVNKEYLYKEPDGIIRLSKSIKKGLNKGLEKGGLTIERKFIISDTHS